MPTKHRIFIAVNLPEDIKKKLADYKAKWPELPCRWTYKDNLHITLAFLGYLSDEEMLDVCNVVKKFAAKHNHFSVILNKITFGPQKKNPPKMVWVIGEKSAEFSKLKNDLEKSLSGSLRFSPESRVFSPHITLARINAWELKRMEPEERPEIDEDIDLNFKVNSIEVMESLLKRGGPEYIVLESVELRA